MRVGKRLQQDGVDQAEDGGAGSDAERESENRDGSEAGIFAEHAESETDVLQKSFEEGEAAAVADGFFG